MAQNQPSSPCSLGASSRDIDQKLTAPSWCQEHKDLQERQDLEEEVHLQGLEVVHHEVLEELEDLELLLWLP